MELHQKYVALAPQECGWITTVAERGTSPLDRRFRLAIELAPLLAFALVEELLAANHRDLGLHSPAFEVEPERDDRQPLLDDLYLQSIDLAAVKKQFAFSLGLMVFAVAMAVRRDVGADQERLAAAEIDVAILEVDPRLSERFDFGAGESDSGLDLLQDEVVVKRLAIRGDQLFSGFTLRSHGRAILREPQNEHVHCYNPRRMAGKKIIVHVVGTGTIGEPLIGLFNQFKERWGIEEVTFHKRTPAANDRAKVNQLIDHGARLATDEEARADFAELGHRVSYTAEEAIERATVVVDCTPAGLENKDKYYKCCKGPRGSLAQGSEFGFGK